MNHVYSLYGLSVGCDRPLPVPPVGGAAQVTLQSATAREWARMVERSETPDWFTCRRLDDGGLVLHWSGVATFLVSPKGEAIHYRLESERWSETLLHHLFVQVLSFSLLARGKESLHGTAVQLGRRALALVGRPGAGKSTLAAALVNRGGRVVCDDLVAFDRRGSRLIVHPGLPHLKLLPRSAFLAPAGASGPLLPGTRKKIFPMEATIKGPPLGAIYLLGGRASSLEIEPLTSSEALAELLAHPFNCVVNEGWRWRLQLESLSELVRRIPVRRLRYPRSFDSLSQVAKALEQDFAKHHDGKKA